MHTIIQVYTRPGCLAQNIVYLVADGDRGPCVRTGRYMASKSIKSVAVNLSSQQLLSVTCQIAGDFTEHYLNVWVKGLKRVKRHE